MSVEKELFLKYLGQTTHHPMGIEISHAKGCFLFDQEGEKYYDLMSGFSVSNVGHGNRSVIEAITKQSERYLYTMVYGAVIQSPQVRYAEALINLLPDPLEQVFFANSGTEAVEGALKLAKRATGRTELVTFRNSYHGSTQGALSVMGNEAHKTAFRPLLPDVRILEFNNPDDLTRISNRTAAVIIEPIQGEAGIRVPEPGYLQSLRARCDETGTLLIFDEVQTGFGRTGTLFYLQQAEVIPDILVLAKALGGGMPLGAFIASRELMSMLTHHPSLGHLTTFGGHPVSCAAGMAALNFILQEELDRKAQEKGEMFKNLLHHPAIKEIRGAGLFMGIKLASTHQVDRFLKASLNEGMLFDYFLFCDDAIRVAPPLIISDEEVKDLSARILRALDQSI